MTNYVNKGDNRAAAQARKDRHAQRTPLPPKGSTGVGNPAAEVLREAWADHKAEVCPHPDSALEDVRLGVLRCTQCHKFIEAQS